jgi:hypothetical protein
MQLDERYFSELLFDTPAGQALSFLSQFWSTRLQPSVESWGLSFAERHVQLALIYTGEVGNGGHLQFFLNRGGDVSERAVAAFGAMGFADLRDCLVTASQVFPGGIVPVDGREVERIVDSLSDEALQRLHACDEWLGTTRGIEERLLQYLRANQEVILLPERGLSQPL